MMHLYPLKWQFVSLSPSSPSLFGCISHSLHSRHNGFPKCILNKSKIYYLKNNSNSLDG